MSIFTGDAPQILNVILILAAAAERLQGDQTLGRDNTEGAAFPFHV